jgi:hypothetical protein
MVELLVRPMYEPAEVIGHQFIGILLHHIGYILHHQVYILQVVHIQHFDVQFAHLRMMQSNQIVAEQNYINQIYFLSLTDVIQTKENNDAT